MAGKFATVRDGIGRMNLRLTAVREIPYDLVMRQAVSRTLGEALAKVPRDEGTLAMSGSGDTKKVRSGMVQGTVSFGGRNAPYAAATEFGTGERGESDTTKPRTVPVGRKIRIVPVRKKALAFIGSDGTEVFRKSVDHPGVPPQPYLYPAGDKGAEDLKDKVRTALHAILATA